jgi:hypothetical protein
MVSELKGPNLRSVKGRSTLARPQRFLKFEPYVDTSGTTSPPPRHGLTRIYKLGTILEVRSITEFTVTVPACFGVLFVKEIRIKKEIHGSFTDVPHDRPSNRGVSISWLVVERGAIDRRRRSD